MKTEVKCTKMFSGVHILTPLFESTSIIVSPFFSSSYCSLHTALGQQFKPVKSKWNIYWFLNLRTFTNLRQLRYAIIISDIEMKTVDFSLKLAHYTFRKCIFFHSYRYFLLSFLKQWTVLVNHFFTTIGSFNYELYFSSIFFKPAVNLMQINSIFMGICHGTRKQLKYFQVLKLIKKIQFNVVL